MRRRFYIQLTFLAFGLVLVAASLFGQAIGPFRLKIDIAEQPDSPIKLVFDSIRGSGYVDTAVAPDNYYPKPPETVMLKLENVSASQVIAYALVSRGKGFENVQVNPFAKPLLPGNHLFRGFGTGGREEIQYSLDFVLFADGRFWGADKFRRSKQIARYFEGRNAALEQLRILSTPYNNPQDFLDQATNFGGPVSSDPAGDPDPWKIESQFRQGWST